MSTNETAQKNILCYGDSNTWGYIPARNGLRFPAHVRWPGVMAQALGDGYRVIEEGLNGRTTVHDDPLSPAVERNGLKTLGTIFDSHRPLDLAIIAGHIISLERMIAVERTLAESGLPFAVDIFDYAKLTDKLKKLIEKEHIAIKSGRK